MLFFDPDAIAEINPIPRLIASTTALLDAEELILRHTPLVPETRLPHLVEVPTRTQALPLEESP